MGYSVNRRYLVFLSCLWCVRFVLFLWSKVSIIDLYGHFCLFLCRMQSFFRCFFRPSVWLSCENSGGRLFRVLRQRFSDACRRAVIQFYPASFFRCILCFVRNFLLRLFRIAKICIGLFGLLVSVRIGRFLAGEGF